MNMIPRRGAALFAATATAVSLTASFPAQAEALAGPADHFESIPRASGKHYTPTARDPDRRVGVIVQLTGDSVGERVAAAKQRNRALAKTDRADIRQRIVAEQRSVREKISAEGGDVSFSYQDVYNGLAARVPAGSLSELRELAKVASVHPIRTYRPTNAAGVQYIGGHDVWQDTGFTGDGVKVGVIDTGLDYTHADFGGSGDPADFENNDGTIIEEGTFPTEKVAGGFDLVGDDYNADSSDPAEQTPRPDPDPLDCNGHGTHVAGTAAGAGVLGDGSTYSGPYNAGIYDDNDFRIGPGVAPEAKLYAYRVFGCAGSASEDVIVAALERALQDGVDVVNMSLGSPFGRADEPSTVAADVLAAAGVAVVASSGNSGPNAYITGAPASANGALSVAAIDASSPSHPGADIQLSTGETVTALNANGAELGDLADLPVKVLRDADGSVGLGCDPSEYQDVEGALVVTQRGTCARVARAVHGQQAGAAAVAMINSDANYPPFEGPIRENPDTGEKVEVTIPFLGVRGVLGPDPTDDGDTLVDADGETATLAATQVDNPGYQKLADFTSGGPRNPDAAPKPEVTGPGVSVVSAGVGTGNEEAVLSGTSMASPMTAGVAALVTQAHPDWPTDRVKAAITGTAEPGPEKIIGSDPRIAGAGVVQARRAVDTVGVATTEDRLGSLAYGYEPLAKSYTETKSFTLTNTGDEPITYDLESAIKGADHGANVSISPSTVEVPAGGSETVDVTISLDEADLAALPSVSIAETAPGQLLNVRGTITARPRLDGAGVYPLQVPFLVAPRGLSQVVAGEKEPYERDNGRFVSSVPLSNDGVHAGAADVYAWGIKDPNEGAETMDVRSVGVQSLPGEALGGSASDRSLVFAINTHGRWASPSVNEFDIAIDTKKGPQPEYFVVGVDVGAVLAGAFDGTMGSFIIDADGNVVNAYFAEAPTNGSTLLLPALASEIGLNGKKNKSDFSYSVSAFGLVPEGPIDETASARFDSHRPALSTGQFIDLGPGENQTLDISFRLKRLAKAPAYGWLVASVDDPNGVPQAGQVSIQPVGSWSGRPLPTP